MNKIDANLLKGTSFREKKRKIVDFVNEQSHDKSHPVIKARHYLIVDYFNSITNKKEGHNSKMSSEEPQKL